MSPRNLLITGGPSHDLAATSAAVADHLDAEDISSVIVDDLDAAFASLADPDERWDLVTMNTFQSTLPADRHAGLRERWAVTVDPAWERALVGHVRGGGGLLALHTALVSFDDSGEWRRLCGGAWNMARSHHPPLGEMTVELTDDGSTHEATGDLPASFVVVDEAYCDLDVDPGRLVLATTTVAGATHPVVWVRHEGEGRVVVNLLGHDVGSVRNTGEAALLRGAARWAVRRGEHP